MKITPPLENDIRPPNRRAAGFTLVEMMVTIAVFSVAVIAMLYLHMFGMQQDELVNSKLGAGDASRKAFNRLTGEIRSAKLWRVGSGAESGFIAATNGTLQQGNALQISLDTDTNTYIRYYFDLGNGQLCRLESGVNGHEVIARYLTNSMYFQAEDYLGNVKTDLSYKYLIHVKMEFYQYQYPLTKVGPDYYYDYYKMEFRITPHCPDGA